MTALTTAAPEARPAGRRRSLALALLVSAQFVVMLDTSIVNVALPSIRDDLGLSSAAVTWVVNAYVLTFGSLLLLAGRAADLFGRRRLFMGGSALFTVGTLLAAGAVSQHLLVAGRVIQGIGAAALSPAAMSLLLVSFPGEARARAMSVWGAASALGGATGVFAGGLLAGSLGWSAVFLVTVPVSAAAVLLARRVLAEDVQGARRHFDLPGAVTITLAVLALAQASLEAGRRGWTSPYVVGYLAGAALLATTFWKIQSLTTDPLVPLELLRSRMLNLGVLLAVLGGAARASTFVLVALYLQEALAMAPQEAGLAMVPTSITGLAANILLLPRTLRRLGPERTLVLGLVILAGGHLWLANAPHGAGYVVAALPALFLLATGVALSFTPTTMVIAAATPESGAGLASGLAGSATQVGAALGIAGFTAIGIASGGQTDLLAAEGFPAAFTAAGAVALVTALLGWLLSRSRR